MDVETKQIEFNTRGNNHLIDITPRVKEVLRESGFTEGNVTVFAIGSTTGISTVEYEPGLVDTDVAEMYNKIAPYGVSYEHNKTWGDNNGASHLRSTLTGTSFVAPFIKGELILGTWQQIIFIDFDTRSRSRKVVIQIMGKK